MRRNGHRRRAPTHSLPPPRACTRLRRAYAQVSGNIASWHVGEGDEVEVGDVLLEVESDKATIEYDSAFEGYVAKLLHPPGASDIPLGVPIAILVEEQADVAAFADVCVSLR